MDTLFDTEGLVGTVTKNPCVALYGPGPEGARCKGCTLLLHRGQGHSKNWYKCMLRRSSRDPKRLGAASTDHRVNWPACARYNDQEGVAR